MDGLLILDKPAGASSFDMVRQVRRWCRTRRVGHAGTLDPLATGVLPVAVGRATRLIEYLMAGDKVYRATLQLGATTDTQDAEGQVLEERPWQGVTRQAFEQVAGTFVGASEQLPPMYSALKKDGQPLYKLARQGIEVARTPRPVQIDSLVVDDFAPPRATITVRCSKGTYIRTLCHDIGQKLGCGAHMTALRRLACGRFDLAMSATPETLQACIDQGQPLPLLTLAEVLDDWTPIVLDGAPLARLLNGVAPRLDELATAGLTCGERVRFMAGERLVAIAQHMPGGGGERPADFEILKVFPPQDVDG